MYTQNMFDIKADTQADLLGPHTTAQKSLKTPPDRREIFAVVATTTISPNFHVDCGKEIRVVIHTNASVFW